MSQTSKEILAGSIGGVVQVLAGQPFDTIKVRLQSGSGGYAGTLDCISKTIKNEGPSALYKGTLSPLAGISFCVAIQFGTMQSMKRMFDNLNAGQCALTPLQFYLSGGVAGIANSIVSGPVEHIRTRMQVQGGGDSNKYSSTADCFRKIYAQYGLKGIYKGQLITMMREWQGYGGYFFAYEYIVQQTALRNGVRVSDLATWQVMVAGALAGYAMWIPVFPLDVVKSRIQTDSLVKTSAKYKGWLDCMRHVIRTEGVAGLYRGLAPCMLRAGPVNALTFVTYEFAMKQLDFRVN